MIPVKIRKGIYLQTVVVEDILPPLNMSLAHMSDVSAKIQFVAGQIFFGASIWIGREKVYSDSTVTLQLAAASSLLHGQIDHVRV